MVWYVLYVCIASLTSEKSCGLNLSRLVTINIVDHCCAASSDGDDSITQSLHTLGLEDYSDAYDVPGGDHAVIADENLVQRRRTPSSHNQASL